MKSFSVVLVDRQGGTARAFGLGAMDMADALHLVAALCSPDTARASIEEMVDRRPRHDR